MLTSRRSLIAATIGLSLLSAVQPSRAEEPPASDGQSSKPGHGAFEARIVAIQGDDLVLDASAAHGLGVGSLLDVWRTIELRHPVTGKRLSDRFLIARIRLTQVRDVLSLGRVEGDVLREPHVGDIVVVHAVENAGARRAPPIPPKRKESSPTEPPRGGVLDPEAARVTALFESLAGKSVVERIRGYERYAAEHAESRFSRTLAEEAQALRQLIHLHGEKARGAGRGLHARRARMPERALAGMPLSIGVDIEGGADGAVLHVRNAGEVSYVSTPMTAAGPGYFVATIPADRVKSPALELFIEATTPDGDAVPVVGDADEPHGTRVHPIPRPDPPTDHRTLVSVLTDYADYNRLRGDDRAWQTEGALGLRFGDLGVRALRSGFGVYRGVGGSIEELDELGLEPRAIGLTYGYLEGEFAAQPSWSFIVRGALGLGDDGMTGGGQLHLRIGSDLSTNLSIGGEILGGVGLRGITELQLDPQGMFPIVLRSEVTNQPAGSRVDREPLDVPPGPGRETTERSDVGIRAIAQAGYRVIEPLVVSIRGSYQGRTINHAGPGVGGAVTYSW